MNSLHAALSCWYAACLLSLYVKMLYKIFKVYFNIIGNSVEDLINSIRFSLYSINEKNDDSEDSELKYSKNLKIS